MKQTLLQYKEKCPSAYELPLTGGKTYKVTMTVTNKKNTRKAIK